MLLFPPFCQWENRGIGSLNDLAQIMELIRGKAKIQTQAFCVLNALLSMASKRLLLKCGSQKTKSNYNTEWRLSLQGTGELLEAQKKDTLCGHSADTGETSWSGVCNVKMGNSKDEHTRQREVHVQRYAWDVRNILCILEELHIMWIFSLWWILQSSRIWNER